METISSISIGPYSFVVQSAYQATARSPRPHETQRQLVSEDDLNVCHVETLETETPEIEAGFAQGAQT
jgi:hypothetical protein